VKSEKRFLTSDIVICEYPNALISVFGDVKSLVFRANGFKKKR